VQTPLINEGHKDYRGKLSSAKTPEYDLDKDETGQRQSQNKIVGTPPSKDIQETEYQKVAKNKSLLVSKNSYVKSRNDKRILSAKSSSLKTINNNTSLHKNNTGTMTFTPQMRVLHEKLQLRNLNTSNLNKRTKTNIESKQQNLNISNQMSKKMQEKKEEQRNINRYKNGFEQRKWHRGNQRKGVYAS